MWNNYFDLCVENMFVIKNMVVIKTNIHMSKDFARFVYFVIGFGDFYNCTSVDLMSYTNHKFAPIIIQSFVCHDENFCLIVQMHLVKTKRIAIETIIVH